MHVKSQNSVRWHPLVSMLAALPLAAFLGNPAPAFGQESDIVNVSAAHQVNPYLTTRVLTLRSGKRLEEATIAGPPTPPYGYDLERTVVALPVASEAENGLTVPAFDWVFGCSSVSAAMIAGYYDRTGFPDIYTGPTNDGVTPLDNSVWGTWWDGDKTYPNIPLAASHAGVDGRVERGSLDDYWVRYGSSTNDPYLTNKWTPHTWGDAVGDYMKTSQSLHNNTDGATTFYNWTGSATRLTCDDMEGYAIDSIDGTYGRKLFYEARGYTVTDCYNQSTDNIASGGFSFEDFQAEIDAGRPVMLNLEGHTIVGVGYDDSSGKVYLHDTWDHATHTMPWGGSYSGMRLLSVSIVNLASSSATHDLTLSTAGSGSGSVSGEGSYPVGASVSLTATPDSGSRFTGWSPKPCAASFKMPASDLACSATFDLASYKVSATAGPGGRITPASQNVTHGGSATFTVTPKSGYSIVAVSGCGGILDANTYTTGAITADCTVTANFSASYALTLAMSGTGSGAVAGDGIDCGSDCDETYPKGTRVTLAAVADPGSVFAGWRGACSGTSDCSLTMNAAKKVTAVFTQAPAYKLTVKSKGQGTVTSVPTGIDCGSDCTESYPSGTRVTLTATPAEGYSFSGWGGVCRGTDDCVVDMTAARKATATFAR